MENPIEYAQRIAYSTKETLLFTYEMAKKFKDIYGCYVECGVAAGAQIISLIHGCPDKEVWAFDSFEGIPLPSNRDDQMPGIRMLNGEEIEHLPEPGRQALETTGATSVAMEHFLKHVKDSGVNGLNLNVVKGWFEDTLPVNNVGPIAILRLDADLYHSTYLALKHLFKKVIDGGVVIIDDWELPGCRQACFDYFGLINYWPKYETVSNIKYFYK